MLPRDRLLVVIALKIDKDEITCWFWLMRARRIKLPAESGEAVYHCTSRTVNGEFLFDLPEREHLRREIWRVAEFCGVQVLTYTVLSNHFHVLVRIPQKEPISEAEILRRFECLYSHPTPSNVARLNVIRTRLQSDCAASSKWRERQEKLMGDVSFYIKLVKQRFTIGFNKRHGRYGTLWAERFKSTLVEPGVPLGKIAAYIDLNCVRAGLTDDPKDYRFSGYAEAVAGVTKARVGLSWVGREAWGAFSRTYRLRLFAAAADPMQTRRKLPEEALRRVVENQGEVSGIDQLRCRIRFFSDSGILGSRAFLLDMARRCAFETTRGPRPVRVAGVDEIYILKRCRSARIHPAPTVAEAPA